MVNNNDGSWLTDYRRRQMVVDYGLLITEKEAST